VAVREGRENENFNLGRERGCWKRSIRVGARVEALGTRRDHWESTRTKETG